MGSDDGVNQHAATRAISHFAVAGNCLPADAKSLRGGCAPRHPILGALLAASGRGARTVRPGYKAFATVGLRQGPGFWGPTQELSLNLSILASQPLHVCPVSGLRRSLLALASELSREAERPRAEICQTHGVSSLLLVAPYHPSELKFVVLAAGQVAPCLPSELSRDAERGDLPGIRTPLSCFKPWICCAFRVSARIDSATILNTRHAWLAKLLCSQYT